MTIFLSKPRFVFVILLLTSLFMGQIVFADGDGTGGGQNQPLTLVSASIADGATGVPLKPGIKLSFSKNIVNAITIDSNNITVRDNNMQCFSLQAQNGTKIPIDIYMADDQTPEGFAARNDATITPKANLEAGTAYSVVVSKNLEAKNFSAKLGQEIRISFTTEGTKPVSSVNTSTAVTQSGAAAPKVGSTAPAPSSSTTTTTTSSATTASQDTAQPSTVQNGTNTETKPATETANSQQQQVAGTPEKKSTESDKGTKIPKSKGTAKAKNKSNQTATDHSQSSIILLVVLGLVIIAALFIYLYVKKKKTSSQAKNKGTERNL